MHGSGAVTLGSDRIRAGRVKIPPISLCVGLDRNVCYANDKSLNQIISNKTSILSTTIEYFTHLCLYSIVRFPFCYGCWSGDKNDALQTRWQLLFLKYKILFAWWWEISCSIAGPWRNTVTGWPQRTYLIRFTRLFAVQTNVSEKPTSFMTQITGARINLITFLYQQIINKYSAQSAGADSLRLRRWWVQLSELKAFLLLY